ncbi:MAG: hypothetical protein F6J87_07775 [Spirulina sp. SIO3F2]|nr:hypothetical protein [Spirulina sp. SIO3F2]
MNGLTIEAYVAGSNEITLTNSRGIIALPTPLTEFTPVPGRSQIIFSDSDGPFDTVSSTGDQTIIRVSGSRKIYRGLYSSPIAGFSADGTPVTVTGNFRIRTYRNRTVIGTNTGSSPFISAARGAIFDTTRSKPFPSGFTLIAPPPSPVTPVEPSLNTSQFTPPEPTTQPGNPGATNRPQEQSDETPNNNAAPGGRVFRPNGVHTRIVPEWSPGLYQ